MFPKEVSKNDPYVLSSIKCDSDKLSTRIFSDFEQACTQHVVRVIETVEV